MVLKVTRGACGSGDAEAVGGGGALRSIYTERPAVKVKRKVAV